MKPETDETPSIDATPDEPGGPSLRALDVLDEQSDVEVDAERLTQVAARILDEAGVPADASLTVTLAAVDDIADLKERFFGSREATDVLSFGVDAPDDVSPGPYVLGDVVISPVVALHQARSLGRSLEHELDDLLVHGMLHLLGHDHDDAASERAMAAEQRRIIRAIEVSA